MKSMTIILTMISCVLLASCATTRRLPLDEWQGKTYQTKIPIYSTQNRKAVYFSDCLWVHYPMAYTANGESYQIPPPIRLPAGILARPIRARLHRNITNNHTDLDLELLFPDGVWSRSMLRVHGVRNINESRMHLNEALEELLAEIP